MAFIFSHKFRESQKFTGIYVWTESKGLISPKLYKIIRSIPSSCMYQNTLDDLL